MLSSKNNKHVLHPHPVAVGKQLWGQTSVEATIQALREVRGWCCKVISGVNFFTVYIAQHGIVEVTVEGSAELKTIKVVGGTAVDFA